MKKTILVAAILMLSGCNQPSADSAEDGADTAVAEIDDSADAGFEAVAPGEYEIVHDDGRIDSLTVLPGMTWSMVYSDNDIAGGTIFMQGGKTCFVTEGIEGHQCFTGTEPDEDGAIQVTGDDGEVATVRPTA